MVLKIAQLAENWIERAQCSGIPINPCVIVELRGNVENNYVCFLINFINKKKIVNRFLRKSHPRPPIEPKPFD